MKKHSNPKGYCSQCRGTTLGGAVKCLYCGAALLEPTRAKRQLDWRVPVSAIVVLLMGAAAWQLWLRPPTLQESARQLFDAVTKNDYPGVQRALSRGADPNLVTEGGEPPLAVAIPNDRIVELLLQKGADPNKTGADDQTPLERAIGLGNYTLAHRLMDAGANVNLYSRHWGNSPLTLALMRRAPRDLILDLIRRGADVNAANPAGETALMSAVGIGDIKLVKELLARGADVRAKGSILVSPDKGGFVSLSAVDLARRHRRTDIERMLLQKP